MKRCSPRCWRDCAGGLDLAVASRYVDGGRLWTSAPDAKGEPLVELVAPTLLGVTFSDPMSGFFMMRRRL